MAKKKGMLDFQVTEWILKNIGFLLFLGFLGLIYIANAHYAEYNVRRIQELQRDLREKRWYYMSLQSDNMFNSLRSEVADKVREDGLVLFRGEPKKIVVTE